MGCNDSESEGKHGKKMRGMRARKSIGGEAPEEKILQIKENAGTPPGPPAYKAGGRKAHCMYFAAAVSRDQAPFQPEYPHALYRHLITICSCCQ